MNGPDNPAKLGSVVLLFGTGFGSTAPQGTDGKVSGSELRHVARPALVRVGGQDAEVSYEGTSPGIVEGFTQVNLRLPADLGLTGPSKASIVVGGEDGVPQAEGLGIWVKPQTTRSTRGNDRL